MSTQQAKYISSRPSRGIEAISIGHNPWTKQGLFTKTVTLPVHDRPQFFSQDRHGPARAPMLTALFRFQGNSPSSQALSGALLGRGGVPKNCLETSSRVLGALGGPAGVMRRAPAECLDFMV